MLNKILRWLAPTRLAIVRRYDDMNGRHVGEIYEHDGSAWYMVGMSLDNLPLSATEAVLFRLDTRNDFLAPMGFRTVRVGSQYPEDNEAVRQWFKKTPRFGMTIAIQNRFIEHVLQERR